MANWCLNTVSFRGTPGQMEQVKSLFEDLQVRCSTEYRGHLPDFVSGEKGYFFDIHCGDDIFYYCTKWVANPDVLIQIADHYKVDFTCTYDEPGNCIFGEFEYNTGVLTATELEISDFLKFEYDDETGTYQFEANHYNDDAEIKQILLQRKKEDL